MKSCILSITASGHGFCGAICIDGKMAVATSMERLTRKKYDLLLPISRTDLKDFGWKGDPKQYVENTTLPFDLDNDYSSVDFNKLPNFQMLLKYLLDEAKISLKDVTHVAYSYRHLESVRKYFKEHAPNAEFIVPEHHFAHACQAFLPSPFEEAAIMVLDGQGVPMKRTGGDQLSGCLAHGKGNSITVLEEFPVSCSLGGMYAEITRLCGFGTNDDGKTMGLSPYGDAEYYNQYKDKVKYNVRKYDFRNLKKILQNKGKPQEYTYHLGRYGKFLSQFKPRTRKGEFTNQYKNLAYLGQKIVEDVMIFLARTLRERTGAKNLCIAGGVGLNCVANYKVFEKAGYKDIFIYPNAGDNGLVTGQALYVYSILQGKKRVYTAKHDYLGKNYSRDEIDSAVSRYVADGKLKATRFDTNEELCEKMADFIVAGKITSWWQGRSEFGPRSLGNRAIIVDPRKAEMKDILNSRVKFRESYRPFTPSVLRERAAEFFTLDGIESPFMLLAPYVKEGKAQLVPAITHVDNTARVQTVTKETNAPYYNLIKAFEKRTGIPLVLNTSFNVAGEPIVESPEDAIRCYMSTDIDVLGIDNYLLEKKV
ncbi:MAG TPA: carbamoyltransferase C-terminal domain-containing protein [Elusimicrobiales bacterium]|nr:carbamoyltransferase C-terminal domain-containing protein [Elusimicrobiales bacterium]